MWSNYDSKQMLRGRINEVFPSRNERVLRSSRIVKECEFDDEALSETQIFTGKEWEAIRVEELRQQSGALFWFSNEAFNYYFPAFIRGSLEDPENAFDSYVDIIVGMLKDLSEKRFDYANEVKREHGFKPDLVPSLDSDYCSRWSHFTEEQICLIIDWLKWVDREQAADWFESDLISRCIKNLSEIRATRRGQATRREQRDGVRPRNHKS